MGNRISSYSDEIGFEQNAGFSKPKKAVSDAAKSAANTAAQQVKAATTDAINQLLYGSSKPSGDQHTDTTSPVSQQKPLQGVGQQSSKQQTTQQPPSPSEQAKQTDAQKALEMHKRTYDLESEMAKRRQERKEAEEKKKQEEEEKRQREEEEKAAQKQEFIAPVGKTTGAPGRNRKGQRPLAVRQAQTKGETGRNVVAG